jgi:GTP-binding protein HflX
VAAAGGVVGLRTIQERPRPDPATFVGKGKLQELALACDEQRIELVVFDHELSPSQLRQIERMLRVRVIDRTQLILDIFARRAQTREGKWQVELAQLQYLLPRLVGAGIELSGQGGGIGTRGPGETKLETDRRRIRHRIATIGASIEAVRQRRSRLRDRRQKGDVPTVALVGYTNAGKTTLFNLLTRESAVVSDALFVTLDPLVRKVRLPDQRELLVSDTVGFIDRLPHALVAAFRATLEEAREADLLLHVIDASADDRGRRMAAVHTVLEEVGAADVPRIDVYNKADMVDPAKRGSLEQLGEDSVVISALHAQGHADLVALVTARLGLDVQRVVLRANPDTDAGRKGMAWVYRHGRVVRHTNSQTRAIIDVDLPRRDVATFRETFAGSPDVRLGRGHP